MSACFPIVLSTPSYSYALAMITPTMSIGTVYYVVQTPPSPPSQQLYLPVFGPEYSVVSEMQTTYVAF
ncbi:hypothetical protein BJV74DRAFT_884079 [Russula compacta]|nr:hypothetical protein BJV74DRAFT_884079 [Russula compacta]